MTEPTTAAVLLDFIDLATDEGYIAPAKNLELRKAVDSLTKATAPLLARIAALEEAIGDILDTCELVEGEAVTPFCPICESQNYGIFGHAEGCAIAAALSSSPSDALAALRREAVEEERERLRAAIGEHGGDEGLPHWHQIADQGAERFGVFVERGAVLKLLEPSHE